MKKRLICLLGTFLLLLVLPLAGGGRVRASQDSIPNIIDEARIISTSRESDIATELQRLENENSINIVILTVTEMRREDLNQGRKYYDIQAFAEDYYYFIYCGGVEKDGIILCVNMEMGNREFCVVTTGAAINKFQRHMRYIYDRLYEDMSRTEYDDAVETFLKLIDTKYRLGFYPPALKTIAICLGIGLLAGWLVTKGMRSRMNNVALAPSAGFYVVPGSFHLRRQNEMFLYSRVTQTARQQQKKGGGIHVGSSGISHGGGGGRRF